MRHRAVLVSTALSLLIAAEANANGRFPLAQRFFQADDGGERLMLSATFGLLLTGDGGDNWYHVCESSFAFATVEGDALLELLPNGTMLSGIFDSLNASTDCGCTWQAVAAAPEDETIIDVARSGSDAVISLVMKQGAWNPPAAPEPAVFRVDRSTNGGASWTTLSELPASVSDALTLDAAPSDSQRVYVSGIADDLGVLLVSSDGGETWESRAIDGSDQTKQPFIAAVHPDDEDTVFIRTNGWVGNEEGTETASDALVVTDDAGVNWDNKIERSGKLFGFALSPDASTVLVGYGDPILPARVTVPEELGVYRASTSDYSFERIVPASVSCLAWTGGKVYGCFDGTHVDYPVGFALGAVEAADLEALSTPAAGASELFDPLLALADVRGPLACAAETCLPDWQDGSGEVLPVCSRLGAECDVDPSAHVVECDAPGAAGSPGSGGTSGGSGNGATGGAVGSGGSGGGELASGGAMASAGSGASSASGTGPTPSSGDDSSCGCRLPGRPPGPLGAAGLLGLLLLAFRRRAR